MSNDTENVATSSIIPKPLLQSLKLYMMIPLHAMASSIGVVTNFMNMLVQLHLGVNTTIGVGVFSLSFTDFAVTLLELAVTVCSVTATLLTPAGTDIDVFGLGQIVFAWIRYPFFFISCWITTIMAIEKCLAVALPLRVKEIFTRNRSICIVISVYTVFMLFILPVFTSQYMEWQVVGLLTINGSTFEKRVFTIVFTEHAGIYEAVIDISCALVLSVTSQSILIICTIAMIYHLKLSSRVRRKGEMAFGSDIRLKRKGVTTAHMTYNEKRMAKVILCLSVILIMCNAPRYVIVILVYGCPEGIFKTDQELDLFFWSFNDLMVSFKCSSHFFVYWLLNRNFRKML